MRILLLILLNLSAYSQRYASYGCIIGNSTIAQRGIYKGVDYYYFTGLDVEAGMTVKNIAVSGNTILQQQTIFLADADRAIYDWIVIEIGLNDLNYSEDASIAMSRYQTLVDTILFENPTIKIIVATMTPCKQNLIDGWGEVNGTIAYNKWLSMNESIMNGGLFPITNVDYRVNEHTLLLNDGNGNLAATYDTGDHVHENTAGRIIIANSHTNGLKELGIMQKIKNKNISIGSEILIQR